MVTNPNKRDQQIIDAAVAAAERRVAVHFGVVVRPFAAAHHDATLVIGLTLGTMLAVGLCAANILAWPWAMIVQLSAALLFVVLPIMQKTCAGLLPVALRRERSRLSAAAEYARLKAATPSGEPVILLFVATGERHVHILASRAVHAVMPAAAFERLVNEFTSSVKRLGIASAVVKLLGIMAEQLEATFPVNQS